MLDYYKNRNPSLIDSEYVKLENKWVRRVGDLNIYGEPGVYPQFGERILNCEIEFDKFVDIFVIPESGEVNEDMIVFS